MKKMISVLTLLLLFVPMLLLSNVMNSITNVYKQGSEAKINDVGQVLGLPNFENMEKERLKFVLSSFGCYGGCRSGKWLYKNNIKISFENGLGSNVHSRLILDKIIFANKAYDNAFDKKMLSFWIRYQEGQIFLRTSLSCIIGMHVGKFIGSGIADGCYKVQKKCKELHGNRG